MTATLHTAPNFTETWVDTQHDVPNFALRRAVVGLVAALLVLAVAISSATAIGSLTGLGGRPAAASEAVPVISGASSASIYVAAPGDSLWSIAESHRGSIDRNRYIDALIDLNGGTAIQAGQAIRLP